MKKETIEVKGMSCKHCESRVNSAVGELSGVKKVDANAKKSSVTIQYDETVATIEKIKAVINEEGFEAI